MYEYIHKSQISLTNYKNKKLLGNFCYPSASNDFRYQDNVDLYTHPSVRLHGEVLNEFNTGTSATFTCFRMEHTTNMSFAHCLVATAWCDFVQAVLNHVDCLCGLVARVLDYRSRGLGFDSRALPKKKEVVGLERGPLSLVSTTEELLDRKVAAPV
jgi:hypothetical protein